jgi:hypothetical protein
VSDTGKRWWRVTGLAAGPAYSFAASPEDARERVGRAYLDADPVTDDEAIAHFERVLAVAEHKGAADGSGDQARG